MEFLFYYNIPESKQLQVEVQTLEFKDQEQYLAWIERAIPIMEEDADRKSYARAARVPIGKAFARRARAKRMRQATATAEILERVAKRARAMMADAILERVAKHARAMMANAGLARAEAKRDEE